MKPQPGNYPAYYGTYIDLVKQTDVMTALLETTQEALSLIRSISPQLEDYAYADGKWTVKEVFLHCADTERVFCCRALGFARGELQRALSFDETIYAANSHASARSLKSIALELEAVSRATTALFGSFAEDVLERSGETPTGKATVNAVGFMISGHTQHHLAILRERYLK